MKFKDKCYKLLKKVPKGKVVTYKEIARALNTRAYRAVGRAMKVNPNPIIVPCHRVIKSSGKIGGYAKGVKKKIQLLRNEGIKINNRKIDLKKYGWRFKPTKKLK